MSAAASIARCHFCRGTDRIGLLPGSLIPLCAACGAAAEPKPLPIRSELWDRLMGFSPTVQPASAGEAACEMCGHPAAHLGPAPWNGELVVCRLCAATPPTRIVDLTGGAR